MDRLTVGNPKLVKFLIDLCESGGIRYQRNIGGGTGVCHTTQSGGRLGDDNRCACPLRALDRSARTQR